ncbi:toll/interleukin-1 receptor domain-containing protein [Nostocaceae cyanobacterium CENA369]|uniref:Toll/interleukin-1 receptor domain-containing protein n=2 Tax=Dendronalium TaxID=2840442 RepID=A0A8J7HZC0_9NOST|nr:toll/interleukin-1 receptor domain-containing protein [Dendronalium phyllosphericum CENA369]
MSAKAQSPQRTSSGVSTTQFDVFLAHNTQDKPEVRAIALALKQRNIKSWIDEEQIPPGRFFQEEIQKAISSVKSAAIFIGLQGIGKWQNWELKAFISQCVEKKIPVIPVLLPGVNNLPEDLIFLKELSWVIFSNGIDDENALDLLEWGITEKKPKNREKLEQEQRPARIPTQELITSISDLSPEQRERLQQERNLLHILTQSLNTCSNDNELHLYKTTINTALRRCNPQGSDRSWQQQLQDLSNHPAPIGWETEGKLVYFVMMLAWMKDTPTSTLEELKAWVELWEYSGHKYKYSDLFVRIDDEMRQKKISPSNECECVMVAVEQVETSTDQLRVSLWAVPNRETYKRHNPPMPLVLEEVLSRQELPAFVRKKIRDKLRKEPTPTIHLFVPRMFFGDNFEMLPSSRVGAVLGNEYPLVVRTNLKIHPIGWYYYDDWHEKWQQIEEAFENNICDVAKFIDCSLPEKDLIPELATTDAVVLKNCDSVGSWFDLIAEETALPVALWSRDPLFQDQLARVLDDCIVKNLPDRIHQERKTAHKSTIKSVLGHHLSLVWEDPKIVPPNMQFDSEMC